MKTLATLLLTLSLPGSQFAPPLRTPAAHVASITKAHKGGQWYFAETGHAVFCYGPVMIVKQPNGGVQRVATFCKGDKVMVPLKD
jgi:hypothetical protein